MNQPTENRPTFNICNSSLTHSLLYHIDQHNRSSCKGTFGLLYFMGSNNDFCCFKGVTYDAVTLCYKLISFYIDFCCFSSVEPELLPIKVLHCEKGNFSIFFGKIV